MILIILQTVLLLLAPMLHKSMAYRIPKEIYTRSFETLLRFKYHKFARFYLIFFKTFLHIYSPKEIRLLWIRRTHTIAKDIYVTTNVSEAAFTIVGFLQRALLFD